MKFKHAPISQEMRDALIEKLNTAEDKSQAIMEIVEEITAAQNSELISQVLEEARRGDTSRHRQLTERERTFYEALKKGPESFRQSVTADQIDIIPTEIIDFTLNDVKQPSGIRKLIRTAPANVKKWLVGSKTGVAVWGNLTDAITGELTATLTALNMDVFKLTAYCIIPKAIRDLEIGYVDRYFTAILNEAMEDGIVKGYINGDGKVAPIGLLRKVDETNVDQTYKAKTVINTVTGFSPAQLKNVLTTLSHNGTRSVTKLYVLCNPADAYAYVYPALYGDSFTGGYIRKSFIEIEVIEDANITAGTGIFTIEDVYTMGFQGVRVDEYKETKALEDADVIIAKVYANGRAVDNDAAVPFDITKLEEYAAPVAVKGTVKTKEQA
jgi:HK97 family phage major capsid protein